MKFLLPIVLIFAFLGCGYKPVSYYAKKSLGENVYIDVVTSPSEPENTQKIKDQVRMAFLTKFGTRLIDDKNASDVRLRVQITRMDTEVLQINNQGYAIVYRMNVGLTTSIAYKDSNKTKSIISTGSQDFPVDPSVGISSSAQSAAIGSAASKAVDSLISQLALTGAKK